MSKRPIILVSPDMRPSVMGVARSLAEAELLDRFVTTLATNNGDGPAAFKYFPASIRKRLNGQLKRREVPSFLNVPVETIEFPELVHLAARRFSLSEIAQHRVWEWSETSFDQAVARKWVGRTQFLYGCEHASVETFRRQKEAGGFNILWQVTAHHEYVYRLLREEFAQFPAAMTDYQRHLFDSIDEINERKNKQFSYADLIVTNSDFSRKTFIDAGVSPGKVVAVPTGCPSTRRGHGRKRQNKLRFLSAGNHSLQKGTPYLLDAWRKLKPSDNCELLMIGDNSLPTDLTRNLPTNVTVRPRVSSQELQTVFDECDVLVLPTLAEGRAHIVLEALAAGLAIITTENSGCGDMVQDGVTGWKVPIRDADALADRINWCIGHRDYVAEMQRQAIVKANSWQVQDFMTRHADVIREFVTFNTVSVEDKAMVI